MSQVILADPVRREAAMRSSAGRRRKNTIFLWMCMATALLSVAILAVLLTAVAVQGVRHLSLQFLTAPPSPNTEEAGVHPALFGTLYTCLVCALFTLPIGVATAVFLEEFRPKQRVLQRLHGFIQLNIANLAGVPSVVYGIIGLTAFVGMFGLFGQSRHPAMEFGVRYYDQYITEGDQIVLVSRSDAEKAAPLVPGMAAYTSESEPIELNVIGPDDALPKDDEELARTLRSDAEGGRIDERTWYYTRIPFGQGVLAGGLTLMLVVLPILIIASQEALRAVPNSLREGALGLGATRWQTIRRVTLPAAIPGIMTGSIISMSRAIGEAAPILMIAGIVYITAAPQNLMDDFTVMPLQIYNWAQRPQDEFHRLAATGILVLLAVLLTFNSIAVLIRQKLQKPLS